MYKLTRDTSILRLADSASIPADPQNSDYAEYLAWLAADNTPLPADPVTRAQWELAAKKQAAAALDVNIVALGRMLAKRAAGTEKDSLIALQTTLEQIPFVTDLSSSEDQATAYALMNQAYLLAVAPFALPIRAEFAAQINLLKLTK